MKKANVLNRTGGHQAKISDDPIEWHGMGQASNFAAY